MLRSKLAELNRHIDVAQRRVAQQRVLIDRQQALGRSTDGAKKLLAELQHQLDTLNERRSKFLGGRGTGAL